MKALTINYTLYILDNHKLEIISKHFIIICGKFAILEKLYLNLFITWQRVKYFKIKNAFYRELIIHSFFFYQNFKITLTLFYTKKISNIAKKISF